MAFLQQIIFSILTVLSIGLFYKKAKEIKRNILLGQSVKCDQDKVTRWKNVILLAFGQKKMFKMPFVAILHFFVYAGFLLINMEMVEILIDGLSGTHRSFNKILGKYYAFLIDAFEILAVVVILFCIIFLTRRTMAGIKRFKSNDLKGWPSKDAIIILVSEIILMSLFLTMNAADISLNFKKIGIENDLRIGFIISNFLANHLNDFTIFQLELLERVCWWLHILGVFAFLNYLPYSKHLHIILSFPNAYFLSNEPRGAMSNMPSIQREVMLSFNAEIPSTHDEHSAPLTFGARDIFDLRQKNLLDAYACTECGRCTAVCPANITGKLLSPRKIMMDTRDRLEEVGLNLNNNGKFIDDSKSLMYDYIGEEELRACTTCAACIEECPVSINPMDIILQMRRYLVMEKSSSPQEWSTMFSNMENNFAPWQFSPSDRIKWRDI